jgi:hypothetical protein
MNALNYLLQCPHCSCELQRTTMNIRHQPDEAKVRWAHAEPVQHLTPAVISWAHKICHHMVAHCGVVESSRAASS